MTTIQSSEHLFKWKQRFSLYFFLAYLYTPQRLTLEPGQIVHMPLQLQLPWLHSVVAPVHLFIVDCIYLLIQMFEQS